MGCGSSKDTTPIVQKGPDGSNLVDKEEKEARHTSSRALQFFLPSEPVNAFAGIFHKAVEKLGNATGTASETFKATTPTTKSSTNATRRGRFHNVCAAPIEDWSNFVPPNHPKSEAEAEFIEESLKGNFCFSVLGEDELETIIGAMVQMEVKKNDTIIKQGEPGDYFYVICEGVVHYEVNGNKVGQAKKGHTFGELALLYTSPRAATVIADSDCTLYKVDQKTFRYTLQMQTLQSEKDKLELMMGVNFLKELDSKDVNKLIKCLVPRKFEVGEYLCRKGEEGDTFYLIQEGKVEVTDIAIGQTTYENQVLGPGDYFGERALVTKEPRSANCIGTVCGIALTIDKDTFETVVGSLSRLVLKCQDKRVLSAIKIIQDSHYQESTLAALAAHVTDTTFQANQTIMEAGGSTEAALYLVRQGTVTITNTNDGTTRTVQGGGYFGEEMLETDLPDNQTSTKGLFGKHKIKKDAKVKAGYTVTVASDEDVLVGRLTLKECRKLVDTTRIGQGKQPMISSDVESSNIPMEDLKRHKILGAGTFGQVWLVYKDNSDGSKTPFALKIQSKRELVQNHQAKGTAQERNVMSQLHHPFLIRMVSSYQDPRFVYMLLKLVQGGELFSLFEKQDLTGFIMGMEEDHARFYAAGIFEGLSYMHRRSIVYRDIKPENVLIDDTGYPVIVDLGFAKFVSDKTYTLCGTPLYLAPEVILTRGHDQAADHWSFAVLLFEMLTGYTPFYQDGMDQMKLFRAITQCDYEKPPPNSMTPVAEKLISRLLEPDPTKRLGSLAGGIEEIYMDKFFEEYDFFDLRRKEIKAPWIPDIKDPLDTSQFDNWDHLEDKTLNKDAPLPEEDQKIFENF